MTLPPPLREEASLRRWIKNTETPFVETWSLRIKTSRIPWLCDVTSSQSRVQVSGTMAWRVSHQHGTTQSISPVAVGWLQRSLVFLCEFMYCSSIEIITNNNYTYIYMRNVNQNLEFTVHARRANPSLTALRRTISAMRYEIEFLLICAWSTPTLWNQRMVCVGLE